MDGRDFQEENNKAKDFHVWFVVVKETRKKKKMEKIAFFGKVEFGQQ